MYAVAIDFIIKASIYSCIYILLLHTCNYLPFPYLIIFQALSSTRILTIKFGKDIKQSNIPFQAINLENH